MLRRLEMHTFPHIGNRPIAEITPPELLECLRKVEKAGHLDMAGRTKQVCGQVFRYGIQTGKCERDAAADLKGALKPHKKQHFRTIDEKDIPAFIRALERNQARLFERTRRAIWLSLLTFLRPGEIRQAQWSEIDLEGKKWVIPAIKMKGRKDHVVSLSNQAVEILKAQKDETGFLKTDYVFPSQIEPRKCMSDGTVNRAIKRLGFGESMVAHGVRALARTVIRETLGYDSEILEKQLAHKTAVITGAGRGIGRGIARLFALAGAKLVLAARSQDQLEAARVEMEALGAEVLAQPTDVTNELQVAELFAAAIDRFQKIDLLVNNAGAFNGGPLTSLSLADWEHVMGVNLRGPFLCTREAMRHMAGQGGGRIINIGSISAQRVRPESAAYSASKHGLWGLTQVTSLEGREHGVTCCCLHPGNTMVERREASDLAEDDEPMMRVDDIAEVALLMASLPAEVEMLEAIVLPKHQAYVGRG
jgi:NAD(P)-dependent dehydrogenase (short-subunit alcohol dehydrogenase family)